MGIGARRLFGVLAVGGGFLGLALDLSAMVNGKASILALLLSGLFGLLYCFGIWCGLQMIERADGALALNRAFWAIQIPMFMSPFASYQFACGAQWYVFVDVLASSMRSTVLFGSQFQYSLMQPEQPAQVGVNLFAIGVVFYLSYRMYLVRLGLFPVPTVEPLPVGTQPDG